jgi:hypothetical protein
MNVKEITEKLQQYQAALDVLQWAKDIGWVSSPYSVEDMAQSYAFPWLQHREVLEKIKHIDKISLSNNLCEALGDLLDANLTSEEGK